MPKISLRIHFPGSQEGYNKKIQFDDSWTVKKAIEEICMKQNERKANINVSDKDYALFSFKIENGIKTGFWLDPDRELQYYLLRDDDNLEFRNKMRSLKVRLLDNSIKTIIVDESQPVEKLMPTICDKLGVANYEEYSLVREFEGLDDGTLNGTLNGTMMRSSTLRKNKADQKMEQLKRKLKTDDDMNWIDHSKTLEEQGIGPNTTLIFRRKFFYSDQNVDSRDPMQLHLLYVQTRDAIINGTHPVTLEQACKFAGLQCQTEYGDYIETKHKSGFLDLKNFLPRDYIKQKNVEKRIFAEHRSCSGLNNVDAKVKYVTLARSLKTYGVTFFLVKEKMKDKNKLTPRLLGVTKDSVLRLDEKTKEILKTWPLTTVKRWAPTPNSFTLDFGDYSDSYYSVQTTEGEQIAKLIAGYIDIILKRKKAKDHFGIDGDEGSAMIEDSVSPSKATIMQHQPDAKPSKPIIEDVAMPGVIRTGGTSGPQVLKVDQVPEVKQIPMTQSAAPLTQSPVMAAQHPKYLQTGLSEPQRALLGTIGTGQDAVQKALNELNSKATIPEYGPDLGYKQDQLDVKKETVSSQMAALNAATAQVLTLTSVPEEEVDHPALGAAINTITTNLPAMAKDVKVIAALTDDHDRGDKLMNAARNLCNAFSDLLRAAEPSNNVPRQNLISAANKISDATYSVLHNIDDDNIDREVSDTLLSLSKPVANTTAELVRKAKDVASRCDNQAAKNRVISAATQCALATSQLVSCAKVVAPTIQSPNCQKQIIDASKEVSKAVDGITRVCQDSLRDPKLNGEVKSAANDVNDALNNLLNYVRSLGGTGRRKRRAGDDGAVDTILDATDRLFSSTGDASEMVKQAKILAQATSQLIQNIKGQAETQPDSAIQDRLLSAAKNLADATSRLVEAAKGCATNPNDSRSQAALRAAAEDLRNATNSAASNALKQKLMSRLESTAKYATAMATQNIAAVHGSSPYNQNTHNQNELNQICREVNGTIPPVVSSIKAYQNDPNNSSKQSQMINACKNFIMPATRLANVSLSSSPTITDKSASIQLTQSAQQLAESLSDLRSCLNKASESSSYMNEIDAAIDNIRQLNIELSECRMAALKHNLKPLPDDDFNQCSTRLNAACKSVASAMAQLLSATSQGEHDYIVTASRDVTSSLRNLTSNARGVASTSTDRDVQMQVLDHSNQILEQSITLFEEIRWSLENQQDSERHQRLTNIAKSLSNALQNCVTCLPSHKDVDESIRLINDSTRNLNYGNLYSHKSYAELQNGIADAAARLNEATSEVIECSRNPSKLATASKNFSSHYSNLFNLGSEITSQTNDSAVKSQIMSSLEALSSSSSRFLSSAKTVSSDPSGSNSGQLASAARSVTQSISNLLDVCSLSAPGQKECDQAIQNIQMMRSYLENPCVQLNDSTYFECLELVTEKSRKLGDAMTGIANYARHSEHDNFGESVKEASDSVCGLLEGAAQAAYLVGASDPTSTAGRPGIIDINLLNRSQETIDNACRQLLAPNASKEEIIRSATEIAQSTSNLCNACRNASSRTQNPYHRKNFVQSAKDIANATTTLIKEIKPLEESNVQNINESCRQATRPLLESVDNLISFASSPEFASVPAEISIKARQAQEPITTYGKSIIDASSNMIMSAKTLAVNPKDSPGWQTLANHSKNVSNSIKKLVTSIKDASPGQNECDDALEKLSYCIKKLDQSSLDAINKVLHVRNDNNLKGFREAICASLSEIKESIDPVRVAGKSKAEKLGHAVTQMISYFDLLTSNSIGYASKIPDDKQQNQILDKSKAVCESTLQLVYAIKECGGNPKASSLHAEIEDSSADIKNAIKSYENVLQSAASEEGHVNSIVEQLTKSITRIDTYMYSNGPSPDDLSYVDYQTRMVAYVKEIARIAQDMNAKSATQISQLGMLCTRLSENYANLANDVNGVAASTSNIETASRIKNSVQELGTACVDCVKNAGACLENPGDTYSQRELSDSVRNVTEKCSFVLAAFQAGSRGTQACIMAANSVQGIISDIDTTILFANSGALNPECSDDTFAIYKDEILKTARTLVEDTKTLVAGAASSQEALADAAQNAVTTITQLTAAVKQGAATLGSSNSEAQVMLLNSIKDVAIALNELIEATKTASGKNINDPAMMHLKDSAKVMVTNVTSLLKTVKTVEDEQQRGTRALEATINGIEGEIRNYESGSMYVNQEVTPEHLIRATKPVTIATAKAVAAGTSSQQDDIIVVANMGRKAIHDLLQVCKSAATNLAGSQDLKMRIMEAGKKCSQNYQELLKMIFHILQRPTNAHEAKQQLYTMSRTIATSVTELVSLAEMLKDVDWVDPEDPTVLAENELLGAASSIEMAAQKLANLQPRINSIKLPDEDMNFDEIILEAAKSITQATAMLIRSASNAQKELVATGKVDQSHGLQLSDDGQWSEGLISAARHVAAATHSLVEAANSLVLGQASEEKLISAAKQVASSTAQLLVACKVKADPESQAMKRLQAAGNAVKKATDNLVRAAQQAIEQEEEQSLIISKRRVQGITQEIVAREEILKKERELVEAREKLAAINRAKYGNRPPEEKDYSFTSVQQYNYNYFTNDQINHHPSHQFHQTGN